jgi:glutaconate CoA-transferase, subunit A
MDMDLKRQKHMIPLDNQRPASMERRSKLISLEEAGKIIATKKIVSMVGGIGSEGAMALIRAAIRNGATGLTLIPPTATSIAADLLIAAGCLKKLYLSYVGFEANGFAPAFRKAAEAGTLEVIEADEPFINLGTQAAAGGRPFNAVQYMYESTSHSKLNPELRKITDPYSGKDVYLIPALRSDVFIMHAQAADVYGNSQCWGGNLQEPDKAKAADCVIVQTDDIVGSDVITKDPYKTTIPGVWVDYVVHTPFGAHPTFSPGNYATDEKHLKLYVEMGRAGKASEYLDKYVFKPKNHFEYLELIGGLERLTELRRMIST